MYHGGSMNVSWWFHECIMMVPQIYHGGSINVLWWFHKSIVVGP